MKQIKFRASHKELGVFYDIWFDKDCLWVNLDGSGYDGVDDFPNCLEWTIEQYTGLKDKNGVEIYEGDMVALDLNNYGIKKCVVRWHKECLSWVFDNPKDNYFMTDIWFKPEHIEVIGNIHEGVK